VSENYFWNNLAETLDRRGVTLSQQEFNQAGSGHGVVRTLRLKITKAMHDACIGEMRAIAAAHGWPGPDVPEHAEGYDGPCFCEMCRSYA